MKFICNGDRVWKPKFRKVYDDNHNKKWDNVLHELVTLLKEERYEDSNIMWSHYQCDCCKSLFWESDPING